MTEDAVDAMGARHARVTDRASVRIVSLVPSLTELLCDLGLAAQVVGRTGFCIHPAADVPHIAKIGGTKTVNVEKIRALAPTHLVVNIDENEKPTVETLAAFVPHVIVTHPQAPRDNLALYRLFGTIFDRDREAGMLCARFEKAMAALAADHAASHAKTRDVLYLIWKDPWMTIARDTYIAAMLELIGWRQIAAADAMTGGSTRYPAIDLVRAVTSADLVLLSSEPYLFNETHVDALERQTGRSVRLVDGEMLSWYGSRAITGLGYLRELMREG